MEEILFATDKDAREHIRIYYDDCEIEDGSVDADRCPQDDSMNVIGPVSGECSAFEVYRDGELVALLGYWDEAGEYTVKVDGEVVRTLPDCHWALARDIAQGIKRDKEYDLEREVRVTVLCPDKREETIYD